MGVFNARVGNNDPKYDEILGKYGEDISDKRTKLLDFYLLQNMIISNFQFKHKEIHTYTRDDKQGGNIHNRLHYSRKKQYRRCSRHESTLRTRDQGPPLPLATKLKEEKGRKENKEIKIRYETIQILH